MTKRPIQLGLRFLIHTGLSLFVSATIYAEPEISFNRDIRPILADHCFACHGPDANARKSDLRLDLYSNDDTTQGAESVLEDGMDSEFVRRISSNDPEQRMPPMNFDRDLTDDEKKLLRLWVNLGGGYETHWAFVTPSRPKLPSIKNTEWPRNEIDFFVLDQLEQNKLSPSLTADGPSLKRRISLDLVGLPPTVQELSTGNRLSELIDDLFQSPRFGEHWASMWLDAARYADTNGYNNDTPRYNWRYRDWVISAFNQNLPYDQFILEQLAGDLLPDPSVDQQIATGFNRNHNVTSEGGIVDEEYRLEYVADRVHTTSMALMGLTLRCARCHDHKFDPISQREYYQVFAFFNQVPETGYHQEHVGNPKPVVEAPLPAQQAAIALLNKKLAENTRLINELKKATSDDALVRNDDFKKLYETKQKLMAEQKTVQANVPTAMVMRDMKKKRPTFLLRRGAYDQPGEKVEMGVPGIFPPFPESAPRNRLGFARWLVSKNHPLTARVMVNRVWAEIFGHGIVATLEDFGTQGAVPTNPKLLDWLAVEFIESGWDLQHILRLIVNSAAYRQSSVMSEHLMRVDPQNRLLARGPRFRLKAEVIRDSALAVSGLLVQKIGGPSVRPYQPAGLWVEVAVADDSYSGGPFVPSQGEDLYRRSVYSWWKRTCPPPNLNALDAPEREFCRVQRSRTNTPLQALVLMNDPTFVESARKMAERMLQHADDGKSRLEFGFQLVTARTPTASELKVLRRALATFESRFQENPMAAKELLTVGDSPAQSTDPKKLAAYATVANILLNLDEFLVK